MIREAKDADGQFIATPEMTSLLDRREGALLRKTRREKDDEALATFREIAKELNIWLLIGSLPIRISEEKRANRSFLISPDGAICARYDKIHMFDADLGNGQVYKESNSYIPGDVAVVVEIPQAKIGLTLCCDLRFPQLYQTLTKAGAEIIIVPSSFTKTTGEAHWHVLLRARAIENGCFIIAPAQGGKHADGRETFGHSLIVGPWGDIITEGGDNPGIIQATIDLSEVVKARQRIPSLLHHREFKNPEH